jgi:hypothetical protein
LPLPRLAERRRSGNVYGMTAVDARGRLAERMVIMALGWHAGDLLSVRVAGGAITITTDAEGHVAVSRNGRVHLPADARHACAIDVGDRVLLAAEPQQGRLVVHPVARLDVLFQQSARAGDAR